MATSEHSKYDKITDLSSDTTSQMQSPPSPKYDSKAKSKRKFITIPLDEDKEEKEDALYFMGINIGFLSPSVQFTFLASVCFVGFWICGYVEESIFGHHNFKSGWFLATFELTFFCIVTFIANSWTHIPTVYNIIKKSISTRGSIHSQSLIEMIKISFAPQSPMHIHVIIGLAMTFARSLTLFSLVYLNYPTQVIFKSMKLLFVLLGSYCCFGKKYTFLEVSGHCLLVFAAILFSLGDHESQTRFTMVGVVIVLLSLVADSVHANFQEYALKVKKSTYSELMIYSNGIAAILSGIACIVSKEIYLVIDFLNMNPKIWMLFLIRSLSIYIGAIAYLALTKRFGAVKASEVTTARKVLTIITSYYFFPKPFIIKHSIGSIAFASAILASLYSKRKVPKKIIKI